MIAYAVNMLEQEEYMHTRKRWWWHKVSLPGLGGGLQVHVNTIKQENPCNSVVMVG
jgi:hypothetical protein